MDLPELTAEEKLLQDAMHARLIDEINRCGGQLPFDRYMELALYAPGLGYYVNGRQKFGAAGDFVTAPEVSPLFGRCVAQQVAQCLGAVEDGVVLELGAGSGRLAIDVLRELERLTMLPARYLILELSPDLQQLQRENLARELPQLLSMVEWLERLPERPVRGVILGNEVVDALPVQRFRRAHDRWLESYVGIDGSDLVEQWGEPGSVGLDHALARLWPDDAAVPEGYSSEINLRLTPWLAALAAALEQGSVLLIDYGYTRQEYYHPERAEGTLICHFRHRAFADPYRLPGLQDMTANVEFTALAEAGVAAGLHLSGFTTQAHFLIACGLDRLLADGDHHDDYARVRQLQGVKQLTLPTAMGERFKAMALTRGVDPHLTGFRSRDLRDRL